MNDLVVAPGETGPGHGHPVGHRRQPVHRRRDVTGESWARGERDFLTTAWDSETGAQRRIAGYGRSSEIDAPMAVAAGPFGVYVAGLSQGRGSLDAVTIAYPGA